MSNQQTDGQPSEQEQGESNEPNVLMPQSGPDRDDMAASYLPEQDDWLAKTVLDVRDPQAIAALSQFETMFPEVEDLQPVIDGVLNEFMRGRTSVGGESRKEYRSIIESMFGGHPDEKPSNMIASALAGEKEED